MYNVCCHMNYVLRLYFVWEWRNCSDHCKEVKVLIAHIQYTIYTTLKSMFEYAAVLTPVIQSREEMQ